MKKTYLTILIALVAMATIAQPAAMTVFSDSEPFILKVDGRQINKSAATTVTAEGITAENIRLFVELTNLKGITATQSIMVRPGTEMKAIVKQNRKGKWVMRYQGESPLAAKKQTSPQKEEKVEATIQHEPQTTNETVSITTSTGVNDENASVSATVTEDENNETVSVTADVNGEKVTMTVTGTESSVSTSSSTTTTTTTNQSENAALHVSADTETNNNQSAGCNPMPASDFKDASNSIRAKTFEDSKITLAKQIIKSNCLRADQIKEIMAIMEYEDSRLTLAKFAYQYCYDPNNYYKVNDAFEYEMTIEELDEYIEAQ
jgi:hypothetical protein